MSRVKVPVHRYSSRRRHATWRAFTPASGLLGLTQSRESFRPSLGWSVLCPVPLLLSLRPVVLPHLLSLSLSAATSRAGKPSKTACASASTSGGTSSSPHPALRRSRPPPRLLLSPQPRPNRKPLRQRQPAPAAGAVAVAAAAAGDRPEELTSYLS